MGTAVGTKVFVTFGWRPAAALSVAWTGFTLLVMLVRGPHCSRHTWFGYEGGLQLRREVVVETPKVVVRISCEPHLDNKDSVESLKKKAQQQPHTEDVDEKEKTDPIV